MRNDHEHQGEVGWPEVDTAVGRVLCSVAHLYSYRTHSVIVEKGSQENLHC